MGKQIAIFAIFFAIAFGGGYFIFTNNQDKTEQSMGNETETSEGSQETDQEVKDDAIDLQQGDTSDNEARILIQRGCVSCHSVSALNVQGGATGPDLSQSYGNVEDKHGVPLDEFLRNPTSAVMSSVLGDNPLTEDELSAVMEALKTAAEK